MGATGTLAGNTAIRCENCDQPWYGSVKFCPYCGRSTSPKQPLAANIDTTEKVSPPTADFTNACPHNLYKQEMAATVPITRAPSVSSTIAGFANQKGEEKSGPPLTDDRHPTKGTRLAVNGNASRGAPVEHPPVTSKLGKLRHNRTALAVAVTTIVCVVSLLAIYDLVGIGKRDTTEAPAQVHLDAVLRSAGSGDWVDADAEIKAMLRNANQSPQGDRRLAQEHNALGLRALRDKDYATAIDSFGKAVAAEPGNVYWINNLGYAYLRRKNFDAAEFHFKQALTFVPNHAASWQNLAETYSEHGNVSDAKAALKLAIRVSTNRKKTLGLLAKNTRSSSKDKFGLIIAGVLADVQSIPAVPLN